MHNDEKKKKMEKQQTIQQKTIKKMNGQPSILRGKQTGIIPSRYVDEEDSLIYDFQTISIYLDQIKYFHFQQVQSVLVFYFSFLDHFLFDFCPN